MIPQLYSGRHDLPREAVLHSQRVRMTSAAMAAVAEVGYNQLTVAHIIKRAGVSRATFYEQFEDKAACFLAAHDEALAAGVEVIAAAIASEPTWVDQVHAGLAALLEFLADNEAIALAGMIHVIGAGVEADRAYQDGIAAFTVFLAPGLDESDADPALLGSVTPVAIGAIAGTIRDEALLGRTRELPQLLPDLIYLAIVGLLGPERALAERARAEARAPRPVSPR